MKNGQFADNTARNLFDNVESVESVYSLDVVDSISSTFGTHAAPDAAAANESLLDAQIYSLDIARLNKHNKALERRACKARLTDRRASARILATGEEQPDRREANQAANIQSLRL